MSKSTKKKATKKAVKASKTHKASKKAKRVSKPATTTSNTLAALINQAYQSNTGGPAGDAAFRRSRNVQNYLAGASQDLVNRTFNVVVGLIPRYAFEKAVNLAKTDQPITVSMVKDFAEDVSKHYHGAYPRIH